MTRRFEMGTKVKELTLALGTSSILQWRLMQWAWDFIEGGWPGSNPKDDEFFVRAKDLDLKTSLVVAFGSTHRSDVAPADDFFLQKLIAAEAGATCIFGKSWDLHVEQALRVSPE